MHETTERSEPLQARDRGLFHTADNVVIDCIWDGLALLGECPLWDAQAARLYWLDCLGKTIWRAAEDGSDLRSWTMPCVIGSIGLGSKGQLVAGLDGGFALLDLTGDDVDIDWLGDPDPDQTDTRLNDGKVDRQGRFWCGTMNNGFATPNAALFRLDPDRSWRLVDDGFTVSNGIAFSPDGTAIYFSDSRVDQSFQYDLDPVTGDVSQRRDFVDTTTYSGRIDGATVDSEGRYWGALFDGGAVAAFSPEGVLLGMVEMPVSCPTMCSFGGAAMQTLFVTSAHFSLNDRQRENEPQAGALFAIKGLGAKGIAEPRFGECG